MPSLTHDARQASQSVQRLRHDRAAKVSRVDRTRQLARLRRVSRLMDQSMAIPGIPIRFGMDSIVGLVPGVGDAATSVVSLWMIYQARRLGVRKRVLTTMLGNVAIDATVGSIPLLGDAFDVIWKANRRNFRLIERELDRASAPD